MPSSECQVSRSPLPRASRRTARGFPNGVSISVTKMIVHLPNQLVHRLEIVSRPARGAHRSGGRALAARPGTGQTDGVSGVEETSSRRRSRTWWRYAVAIGLVLVVVVLLITYVSVGLVRSGGCTNQQGFGLSLVGGVSGQSTPVAAASHEAEQGVPGFNLPRSGWHTISREGGSATLGSGAYRLHAMEGPDGSWRVDSGAHCGA